MNMHNAQPQFEDSSGDQAATAFDQFLTQARRQKDRTQQQSLPGTESWADPDPAAITRLPTRSHPVTVVVARKRGQNASRDSFKSEVRRCCERLQGLPLRSLNWDQVLAYPWHRVDADAAADYARLVYRTFDNVRTRNDCLSVLRQIVTACHRARLISLARRDEVLEELPTVAPGPSWRRRRLKPAEIGALLDACEQDGSPEAIRDSAVIAFFATTGARVGEVASAMLGDWDRADRTVLLRMTKNGGDHRVFVHPNAEAFLTRWLAVRGEGPGALFSWPQIRGGAPVRTATVRYWLPKRQAQAGIAPFGSHDFRRTFASTLLRTHDIGLVAKLLNHRKPGTTLIYDLASEDEQRAAIESLPLPPIDGEEKPR